VSIVDSDLKDTGYCTIAVKTTGLTRGYDGICELSVCRAEPGQPLRLSLDTLVNTGRGSMSGAAVHGILPHHVRHAPSFEEVAADLIRNMAGRVVVCHNAEFVFRFLLPELEKMNLRTDFPFIDTMHLYAMLSRGPNRSLHDACLNEEIDYAGSPLASAAATACGRLWRNLLEVVTTMGITTFGKLNAKGKYPFQRSFQHHPYEVHTVYEVEESINRISRTQQKMGRLADAALSMYYDALLVALDDMEITMEETAHLAQLQESLEIDREDILGLHARVFSSALVMAYEDGRIDAAERRQLYALRECLNTLGWAPGDREDEEEMAAVTGANEEAGEVTGAEE